MTTTDPAASGHLGNALRGVLAALYHYGTLLNAHHAEALRALAKAALESIGQPESQDVTVANVGDPKRQANGTTGRVEISPEQKDAIRQLLGL